MKQKGLILGSSKGFAPVLILLIGLAILGGLAIFTLPLLNLNPQEALKKAEQMRNQVQGMFPPSSPSSLIPTSNLNIEKELKDFIYPGARFIESEDYGPCPEGGLTEPGFCDATKYVFETSSKSKDQVVNWYRTSLGMIGGGEGSFGATIYNGKITHHIEQIWINPKTGFVTVDIVVSKNTGRTNVKVYKNDKYGFEFTYNKGSRIEEMKLLSSGFGVNVSDSRFIVDGKKDDVTYLSLEVSSRTCENWMKNWDVPKQDRLIGGYQADYREGVGAYGKYRKAVCLSKDNLTYFFVSEIAYEGNRNEIGELFDQILSSFKFLNSVDKNELREIEASLNRDYPDSDFTNKINKVEGNFAAGSAVIKNSGGQYAWIARKENSWKIIWQGSVPECSDMQGFGVPKSLYVECGND